MLRSGKRVQISEILKNRVAVRLQNFYYYYYYYYDDAGVIIYYLFIFYIIWWIRNQMSINYTYLTCILSNCLYFILDKFSFHWKNYKFLYQDYAWPNKIRCR